MWAHACDLVDQAERMHRQFFRLASSSRTQPVWEPPVDVFEDGREIVIVAAMPGVVAERMEVAMEAGAVVIRAERALPFAASSAAVRQLEIPYGYFERRIRLPEGRFEVGAPELSHGCLVVRLRKID